MKLSHNQRFLLAHAVILFSAIFFGCSPIPTIRHTMMKMLLPFASKPIPLLRGHAHNDYQHAQPLCDALARGFTSIEVDIHLIDGQLLVAHDKQDVRSDRTLQSLYLNPLRERISQHGGRVYPGGPPITLLIDIKSDAESTYVVLRDVLNQYMEILTTYGPDGRQEGALVAIISGNRPLEIMKTETIRCAACDGRAEDLDSVAPASLIPLISDRWSALFTWKGDSTMPTEEQQNLIDFINTAHSNGRRVRFWATPDDSSQARYEVWRELIAADVDFINTDDLQGLQQFLIEHDPLVFTSLLRCLWRRISHLITGANWYN